MTVYNNHYSQQQVAQSTTSITVNNKLHNLKQALQSKTRTTYNNHCSQHQTSKTTTIITATTNNIHQRPQQAFSK